MAGICAASRERRHPADLLDPQHPLVTEAHTFLVLGQAIGRAALDEGLGLEDVDLQVRLSALTKDRTAPQLTPDELLQVQRGLIEVMNAGLPMLADMVRRRRVQLQLSQSDLAKDSGLSLSTVKNLEDGHALPRRKTLQAIGQALGYDFLADFAAGGAK